MEVYFSVDIEADGPAPLLNSMLSFGCQPFTLEDGLLCDTFYVNLERLPDAKEDHKTMKWWSKQGNAYLDTRQNMMDPKKAMQQFNDWVFKVAGKNDRIFCAYPAGFDFTWMYMYCHKFLGTCPFGFQAWDAKSYGSALRGCNFKSFRKGMLPKENQFRSTNPHNALDDAIAQAQIFMYLMKTNPMR